MNDYIEKALKLNEEQVLEMAYSRQDAIDKCNVLGKQFIEHFHKIMSSSFEDIDFNHHCIEMQAFFDDVKNIKLKQNNKRLSADALINWFFTIGSDVEDEIDEQYQDIYELLYLNLLKDRNKSNVENILEKTIKN